MAPDSLLTAVDRAFAGMKQAREAFAPSFSAREVGTITTVSTGIATVIGLPGVGFEELIQFPGDLYGIAFNVDEEEIGVVLLGDYSHLRTGDEVERTGRVMDVGVGEELLGRVIDPLGRPLDNKDSVGARKRLPIERDAKAIMDRAPVTVPLQTGIKVIDALVPVGRGQRELILGGSVATFRFCLKTPRLHDFAEKPVVDFEALRKDAFRAKPGFFGRMKSLQHFRRPLSLSTPQRPSSTKTTSPQAPLGPQTVESYRAF